MSNIHHRAIIVTGAIEPYIPRAMAEAERLGLIVLGPSGFLINGYRTFVAISNGSKLGWFEGNTYDLQLDEFRTWLSNCVAEDSGAFLDWVEVMYGRDTTPPYLSSWGGIGGDSRKEFSDE